MIARTRGKFKRRLISASSLILNEKKKYFFTQSNDILIFKALLFAIYDLSKLNLRFLSFFF